MAEPFARLGSVACETLKLTVPNRGQWFADVELTDEATFSGRVQLRVGETTLSGTVVPGMSGEFGLQKFFRVVGGAGEWGKLLGARAYANDAGVKARTIAEDLARETGETLGSFAPEETSVGAHFLRDAAPASQTLEAAIGTAAWWVDFAGVTHIGAREERAVSGVEVEHHHPARGTLSLHLDEIASVFVGGQVRAENLPEPVTITEYEITLRSGKFTCIAQTNSGSSSRSRAAELLLRIAKRANYGLFGKYRYRVVSRQGSKLNLQVVRKRSGVPDVLRVAQWPGIGGAETSPAAGSIVLVEFVEGLRSLPVVTGFAPPEGPGHVPDELVLCAGAAPAARQGDTVEVLLPTLVFTGTVGGVPATGILQAVTAKTLGSITGGSGKVKIG